MKLIDKDALVAEIERLEKINQEYKKTWKWKFKWFYRTIIGRLEVLVGLKAFLDTLEVKEVDLEKELDAMITPELKFHKALPSLFDVAKYFFELGLRVNGYHQAEKDNELTWEDIRRIYLIINYTMNNVGMDNLTDKSIYQEVSKRFKERKEL